MRLAAHQRQTLVDAERNEVDKQLDELEKTEHGAADPETQYAAPVARVALVLFKRRTRSELLIPVLQCMTSMWPETAHISLNFEHGGTSTFAIGASTCQ